MSLLDKLQQDAAIKFVAPEVKGDIPHGDMPGDKVEIGADHIAKATLIFPELLREMRMLAEKGQEKIIITVCGGSGVGKSEIASVLSYYFGSIGIGSYTLSGDNYPRRIPMYNDAERVRVYRESGILRMIESGRASKEDFENLQRFQKDGTDSDVSKIIEYPFMASYLSGGVEGLKGYLGTTNEIDFAQIEKIAMDFKAGKKEIFLKRMGRTDTELWYDKVNFEDVEVLIIEWTHGNSDEYKGVDIPILLNSTPEETAEHRRARNRDGKTDSTFTLRVLNIEQQKLHSQAHKAKIIVSKSGELLSFEDYVKLMGEV